MKIILFVFYFIKIIIDNLNCLCIDLWEIIPESIAFLNGTTFTGCTYYYENNNNYFFISYKDSKTSYIQDLTSKDIIEINAPLCPLSYTINSGIHILFTDNNSIYTYYKSKFRKLDPSLHGTKYLKGSLINSDSELLVGYIGTDTLISFKKDDNKLEKKKSFTLDGYEIINFYYFTMYNEDYIYLLQKSNNLLLFNLYQIFEKKLSLLYNYTFNEKLNNITEINFFYSDYEQAMYFLFFSYDENENNFNFYLLEYDNLKNDYNVKISGNKYNFLPFRNAKIIKAFFLPNTEFLIYLIQIGNEKFVGVLDIINQLIIFNFKTISEFISFEESFLIYSENNTLYRVCPFNTNDKNNCYLINDYNRHLIRISSKNVNSIVYTCTTDAPYLLGGSYCYKKCPFGYYISENICKRCPIFDNDEQICVDSCKEGQIYDELNKICYSCKPFNQYKNKELNICVDDCPFYDLFNDEINYICKSCQELGKFLQNGKCVDDCDVGYIKDEENKICVICLKETPYYQNGECVKECSNKYILDIKTKKCILCTTKEPYLQEGKCTEKCGEYYKIDNINKICINCKNDTTGTPFLQNNECVSQCDRYYKIDDSNKICINCQTDINGPFLQKNECVKQCDKYFKIDNINKICINCQNETTGPFLQKNECVKQCDKYYKIDNINKICINCQKDTTSTPYYQNGECVSQCGNNYKIDNINKVCINCQNDTINTPFLQDNECVEKCNDYYAQDISLNKCYNCTELGNNYYYYNKTCIKECPKYYIKDEINRRCYKCNEENSIDSYYENGKCVNDCSKYYYKNETQKICINCTELNPDSFFQDNECVLKCNKNYIIDKALKLCVNCSIEYPNLPYYMDNKCVNKCDSKYAVDKINKICYKCQDKNKNFPYNENGKCVQKCSQYLAMNNEDYLCINCTEKNGTFYQNNSCVKNCSPGYTIIPSTHSCANCYEEFSKYEFKGECFTQCPNFTVNNPTINQCQDCLTFDSTKPFYDILNNKCVDECPIGTEKNLNYYICNKCLNYYNNITKKCVDNCPTGSEIVGKVCQKCNIYETLNNSCVSQCSKGKYPFYIKEDNYSLCYQGFCGYGICLLNESNYKTSQDIINNLYSCNCQDEYDSIYGKYCQYKFVKNSNDFISNINIKIKPLQDTIYVNKINIFTFEYNEEEINTSFRLLSINHTQYIIRRFQFYIEWKLIQNKCPKNQIKEIFSNELYFIVEPETFIDDCENIIQVTISDKNHKILNSTQLYIKTKSMKKENYYINLALNGKLLKPLNNNSPCNIKLVDINKVYENYIYQYYYITEDEEEFTLTTYMKNSDTYQIYFLPYCNNIKARIKNDYGDTIEILSDNIRFRIEEFNNLTSILKKYDNIMNNNYISNIESYWQLLTELKTFFSLSNNYNNSINKEKENLDKIINIIRENLPLSILNENNLNNNKDSLDEIMNIIEPNVFISLINQLAIFYYYNNNNDDINLYTILINIIYNSLHNNNITIDSLNEKTILSYLRTIDNLLLIMNEQINSKSFNHSELHDCISLLKYILSKNMISGTKVKIDGNNFDIYLFKPGYYTEDLFIYNDKIREENVEKIIMQYKSYKLEYNKIIKMPKACDSSSIFCISKENYDLLYDELTYLKNEIVMHLIISIVRINNINSFNSKWNKITNKMNLSNYIDIPKKLFNYSFYIRIQNPADKKPIVNLTKFRYNLYFDLKKKYENNKSDITCIALNSIIFDNNNNLDISNEGNCLTYIDDENHRIVCDCNTDGEIIVVLDKKLSHLTKNLGYQKHEYKIINCISGGIILSSLALITFFSVIFILYEFHEDKNNSFLKIMDINMRALHEYDNFEKLKKSNKYLFALYLIYYKYSFFNVFSTYKYNHPRYIRFFIEMIKILLNILISIIPFYYKIYQENEEYTNEYINIKDINNNDKKNLNFNFEDSLKSLLYSLIASIIIFFIAHIFYKIFELRNIRRLIWKQKKDIFKQYVYNYFKKQPNFNKKLKSFQRRIIAYTNLCGMFILENKKKDKFSSYLEYKLQKSHVELKNYKYNDPSFLNKSNINYNSYKIPLLQDQKIKKCKTNEEAKINLYNDYSINTNSNNKKNKNKILTISIAQSFTLSQKIKNHISKWNIYKLESIRNQYIYQNNFRESFSKTIKYINLSIQTQKNYSYIVSNNISINQLNTTYNKSKMNKIIIINISLFIMLLIIDVAIIFVMNKIYEKYDNYIIMNWLLPVLVQIVVINFLINYLFAVFDSFLLFYYYKKRKNNCFYKCIFNLFVEKYMKYLFKIRTLINKYYRDFENMK